MTWTKTGNIRGPQGIQGPTGPTGPQGPTGPTGSGILPADTTIAVGTRIISNKLVGTDANPVWQVLGSGHMDFGPGGATATDTNLYRNAAGQLKTDGGFYAVGPSGFHWNGSTWAIQTITSPGLGLYFGPDTNLYRRSAGVLQTDGGFYLNTTSGYIGILQPGDAALRWSVDFNGKLQWGPGNAAGDVSLYRNSAGTLNMNGSIYMGTGQAVGGAFAGMAASGDIYSRVDMTNNGLIRFGPGNAAQDVQLYRFVGGVIGVDKQIWVGLGTAPGNSYVAAAASGDGWPRIGMLNDGTLWFGPGNAGVDVKLYRPQSGWLRTESIFMATPGLISGNYVYLGYSTAGDTYIYRAAGNTVGTIGSYMQKGAASGWGFLCYVNEDAQPTAFLRNDAQLWFGPGGSTTLDTNLYRYAASKLATSGDFIVRPGQSSQLNLADNGSGAATIWFGAGSVDYIYHPSAGQLTTNCSFSVAGSLNGILTDGSLPTRLQQASSAASDLNTIKRNGWCMANGGTNMPPGSVSQWFVENIHWSDVNWGVQMAHALTSGVPEIWWRNIGNGTWYSWHKLFPANDETLPARIQSVTYPNSSVADCNNMITSGWYYCPNASAGHGPSGAADGNVEVIAYSAAWITQRFQDTSTLNTEWRRQHNSTGWTPWVRTFANADSAWNYPGLSNGWAGYGGGSTAYSQPRYRRLPSGLVLLQGLMANSADPAAGTVIFNLPAGYRPAIQLLCGATCSNGIARIDITSTGDLQFMGYIIGSGASPWTSLANLQFFADQ